MAIPEWLKKALEKQEQTAGEDELRKRLAIRELRDHPRFQNARPAPPDYRWVPPGEPVIIQGYEISDGMLYVGRAMPPLSDRFTWSERSDPALIDPRVPARSDKPDRNGNNLSYWPWYAKLPIESRAAFLEWLASGRRNKNTAVGYVFLFFYGLERRALNDEPSLPELQQIKSEVDALLATYGRHSSFHSYASSLQSALEVRCAPETEIGAAPGVRDQTWQIPWNVRYGLGRLTAANQPIPADWALAWVKGHPEIYQRTAATRCPEEMAELWNIRYTERFGNGIKVKPGKARIEPTHHPASPSFGGRVHIPAPDLPDITDLPAPRKKLDDLRADCESELDAFSRYVGRNAGSQDTLPAIALLPKKMVQRRANKDLDKLRRWLGSATSETQIDGNDLLQLWPQRSNKPSRADSVAIANLLGKLGAGIEPDVRFGGKPIADGPVILFEQPDGAPTAPSDEYTTTTTMLHLVTAVATADGQMNGQEMRMLSDHLESAMHLSEAERIRLHAHIAWLQTIDIPLTGLTKRVKELSEANKNEIAHFAIAMASVDGPVRSQEVTVIERIFKLLSLDTADLYSQLHGTGQAPVPIQGSRQSPGFAIPQRPDEPRGMIGLDQERIAATMRESARVATFLGDIFEDEEAPPPKGTAPQEADIEGLDAAHSAFLRKLAEKPEWARTEIEDLAKALGLLPDGALDTLNELAFDRCDEPLLEGEEDITVDPTILEELLA